MPETNPFKPGTARFKLWNRKQADKAAANPPPTPKKPAPVKEKGFFDSFFNRGDTIDDAVDTDRQRKNQSTDSSN
jgi:hypothetical protein